MTDYSMVNSLCKNCGSQLVIKVDNGTKVCAACGDEYIKEESNYLPKNIVRGDVNNSKVGVKYDGDKEMLSLMPAEAIMEIGKVFTFGCKKYAADNWAKGMPYRRLLSATLRHIYKFLMGKNEDEESGLNHLAHACADLMMLIYFCSHKPELDDRYKGE